MRIVQFPHTGGVVVYPEEGINAFGQTTAIPGFIVGEYFGEQTDPTLPDYPGEWPIPLPPATTTRTDAYRVYDPNIGLTGDEQAAIRDSIDPEVIAGDASLRMRPIIDLTDPEVMAILDLFVTKNVLPSNRRDELETIGVRAHG